jgi:hypothetical protein
MTIKHAVHQLLDDLPAGLISGWQLFDLAYAATGRKTYPDTLLKYCREYADASGAVFECVDRVKSVYRYEPGARIAGAIKD